MNQATRAVPAILLASMAACVPTCRPVIQDCPIPGVSAWWGRLTVAPSQVDGLVIDSAGWRTDAHTFDIGAETYIVLATRLRTTRSIALDSVALVYRFRAPSRPQPVQVVDLQFWAPNYTANERSNVVDDRLGATMARDTVFRIEYLATVESGLKTSLRLQTICPAQVLVLPRSQLLRALDPGLLSSANIDQLVRRRRDEVGAAAPFLFVYDTVVSGGFLNQAVLGVGVNTSNSPLRAVTVGVVVDTGPSWTVAERDRPLSWDRADTLKFLLGPVGPGDTVTFAGELPSDHRVLGRLDAVRP
jgi:hypothetical protein